MPGWLPPVLSGVTTDLNQGGNIAEVGPLATAVGSLANSLKLS